MTPRTPIKRILAVDVCGTLYNANTTLGLVLHHHHRLGHQLRLVMLKTISTRKLPFTYALTFLHRVAGFDLHRHLTLLSLRGTTRQDLSISADIYAADLKAIEIPSVHAHLRERIVDGWSPVLVSNSVSAIVGPISNHMGVPFIASELAWKNDRCSGRLEKDLTGAKRKHLAAHVGHPLNPDCLSTITDNASDIDLINASSNPVIVSHGPKRKWMRNLDAHFIYI